MKAKDKIFFKNLEVLKFSNPELAKKVEEIYPKFKGKRFHHSSLNIKAELKWSKKEIEACKTGKIKTIVICGAFPPIHIKKFNREISERLICYEPQVENLVKVFSFWDMRAELPMMRICSDLEQLERQFEFFWNPYFSTALVAHPNFEKSHKDKIAEIERIIDKVQKRKQKILAEYVARSPLIFANTIDNLPNYWHLPAVKEMEDLFKDLPAIVVAAGPSLDKNVHLLTQAKGRALIFATGTTLKKLDSLGIVPDFAVAIEPKNILHQFNGLSFTKQLNLILNVDANPKLFELPVKHKFIFAYPEPINYRLAQLLGKKLVLDAGGSVATASFVIARTLGANPIILIGQDLALSEGGKSHAENLRKAESLDIKEIEAIKTGEDSEELDIYYVDGYYGGKVITRSRWLSYLRWYEVLVERLKAKAKSAGSTFLAINATEGGARIKGMEQMTLAEAIAHFCREKIDVDKKISIFISQHKNTLTANLLRGLDNMLNKLKETIKFSSASIELCDYIAKALEQKKFMNSLTDKLNTLERIEKRLSIVVREIEPIFDVLMRPELAAHAISTQDISETDEFRALVFSIKESLWFASQIKKNSIAAYNHLIRAKNAILLQLNSNASDNQIYAKEQRAPI